MTEAPDFASGAPTDWSSRADRPLRIVGVDPERGFAGGESQVLGLTLELLRLGHDAQLLCDPEGALWRLARAENVLCHPLRIRNAIDLRAGLRLRRFLSRNRFDVVHFHTSRAHSMAPFAAAAAGASVVTRRMDYVPNRAFSAYMYNRAVDAVAAISREVAAALAAAGVLPDRITIIPSGVDCRRFAPPSPRLRAEARAGLGLATDEIAVGAVGGLEPRKGHRYLVEALGYLRGTLPAVRCFIAGDGSQREVLEDQIRRLGLDDAIRLTGSIPDSRALLWAIDIFVQPSIKEGLGVALLEAMACGLPGIASRAGGMVEVIEDGHSGRLVTAADAGALAQALRELIESPNARGAIGVAARDRAATNFSMETMARKTLAFYRASLAQR
jgi:glycosyltransferase involved in cell wall biosynthesis